MEAMLVTLIISILIGIMAPSMLGFRVRAWDASAQANLRRILPVVEAYKQDQGTYVGMSAAALQTYDPTITAGSYTFGTLSATSYCVHTAAGIRTWRRDGPGQPFVLGSCA